MGVRKLDAMCFDVGEKIVHLQTQLGQSIARLDAAGLPALTTRLQSVVGNGVFEGGAAGGSDTGERAGIVGPIGIQVR